MALPIRGKRLSPTYKSTGNVPTHQKVYTSPLTKLTHQGEGTRTKENYSPAAWKIEATDAQN